MNRRYTFATVTVAAMAVAFVSGASVTPTGATPVGEKKPDAAKPAVVVGHKTAVFNMAAVMRDFGQAKYQVYLLNNKKMEMSKKLLVLRAEYVQIQTDIQKNPNPPDKDAKGQRMLAIARQVEDEDRKISKQLNDDASAIIGDLYDRMKTVVDKTAEMNGYHIVFAYPDAVTAEEMKSPYIKELKLKPPAAQPFYVAAHADITGVVVKTLNAWYPPLDAKGQLVDVSKLDVPAAGNGVPGAQPGGPGGPAGGPPPK